MSANRSEPASAKVFWGVRADRERVGKLKALEREHGVLVGTWLDMAFEGLEDQPPTELRRHVVARLEQPLEQQLEPWRFTVDVMTVVRAKRLARELGVTQSKLVTLVIDCLTEDGDDDGGNGGSRGPTPGGRRGALLRIIYTNAPSPAPAAAGGLSSVEVVATSTA